MILDTYTVFDVETANSQRDSICSIGYIRVENGIIAESKEILINPETEFDLFNIKVHGITPRMVESKETFPKIWGEIKKYFSNTVLVSHNARSMDLCALTRMLDRYDIEIPQNDYICTYELARKLYTQEEVGSYKLNVLCQKFNIPLEHHHNALDDAKACYGLLNYFVSVGADITPLPYNFNLQNNTKCKAKRNTFIYSPKTLEMQELQVLVSDVIYDGIVSSEEAYLLFDWMNHHSDLEGFYPYDRIFSLINDILADGIVEPHEERELFELLDAYVNPKTSKFKINVNNKTICLSGEFDYGTKSEIEDLFISKGAKISKSVTKKVDILVLGEEGNVAWKYGNYGTKYEKVQQLNEKGANILVYKENDIIGFLENKIDIDERILSICEKLTTQLELSPNKIDFYTSISKNDGNPVSLFIQIKEMNYPDEKTVSAVTSVLRIKADNISDVIVINKNLYDYLLEENISKYAKIKVSKNGKNDFESQFLFYEIDDSYFEFIEKAIIFAIENYTSTSDRFNCCGRYKECSELGECIHPNKLYSTVCEYRKHLEQGINYYKE